VSQTRPTNRSLRSSNRREDPGASGSANLARVSSRPRRVAKPSHKATTKKFPTGNHQFFAKTFARAVDVAANEGTRPRLGVVRREASPLQGARGPCEPTASGCRARGRSACSARPRRRQLPRSPRVGSTATRRVPSPSPRRHPPRPTPPVWTRPSRRRTPRPPRTSPPRSGACTRTSRVTCPPAATSRPRACTCGARSTRPSRASAKMIRTSPPRATTLPSCIACKDASTRLRSCTRSRRPRWRSTTGPHTPPRAPRRTTWRDAS
jgi:hypothetical protein